MEILIADKDSPSAAAAVRTLEAEGHIVRGCRDTDHPGSAPCAALRGADCPLDLHPIDVAVSIGPDGPVDHLGDGDLCAVRHRIPLILLDAPHDTLRGWARAVAPTSKVAEAVRMVHDAVLPLHTARARLTAAEELARHGLDENSVDVEVRRSDGALRVELFVAGSLGAQDAERLAVHVVQSLRLFDPWAKGIDASVHGAAD